MQRMLSAILIALLAPAFGFSQEARDSWDSLKQLQPGHKIKIVDMSLKSWDGRLLSVSDEAITIREKQKQQEITVERAKVFRVTDLQRSRRARSALIGLAIGASLGAVVGALFRDEAPRHTSARS